MMTEEEMKLTTTFKMLKGSGACWERYRYLAKALGGVRSYGLGKEITLSKILELNGLDDALWALRAVPEEQSEQRDRIARLFACWCARNTPLPDGRVVWDLLTDQRSRDAVEVAELFAHGRATESQLAAARDAAGYAASDARDAAREAGAAWAAGAAWDAAWDAAGRAAALAAWDTARDARDAARASAWDAAYVAAYEFARAAQAEQLAKMLED